MTAPPSIFGGADLHLLEGQNLEALRFACLYSASLERAVRVLLYPVVRAALAG